MLLKMLNFRLTFLFFILPFIHGIPYGVSESDDSSTGIQLPGLQALFDSEAPTAQPLYAAANPDTPDPIVPTTDKSQSSFSTTDISNHLFSTTGATQPFVVPAGLDIPTYDSYVPETQDDQGGVSTDSTNGGGSTDTFEEARGEPSSKDAFRRPPVVDPKDQPRHDTPNCDGQRSTDGSRLRFLSCCNYAKTQCVYFKYTHYLCKLTPKWRGPAHPIQCCDSIPMEGGKGIECQNANNPFMVTIPSVSTPFGRTPDVKFNINLPDVPETIEGGAVEGAVEGAPLVKPGIIP